MNCCICIPVPNRKPAERDAASLRQMRRVFPYRPVVLLSQERFVHLKEYEDLVAPCRTVRIPSVSMISPLTAARIRMTPEFYDSFSGYDYVLLMTTDCWAVCDQLDWWMDRGYDYVAAPWLSLGGGGSNWIRGLDMPRGGREGASLRNVKRMREYCRRLQASGFDMSKNAMFEDVVLSGGLPEDKVRDLPEIRYCPRAEQARFAWDRPDDSDDPDDSHCSVRTLMDVTRGRPPMLVYAPSDSAYRRFCVPDEDPETIFMFSSAVRPGYDYEAAVNGTEHDPSRRLLVFMNSCQAFRGNESGLRLVMGERKILTFHNDTVTPPFGPAYFGEIPLFLKRHGYRGLHESRTLRWRSWSSKTRPVVTFDGEIPDERMSESLRRIGPEVRKGSPTCGYQAYRILRDRYPDARIVLVNFFGNSNGFSVCWRHDPGWEQEMYGKDPKVLMIGTKEKE